VVTPGEMRSSPDRYTYTGVTRSGATGWVAWQLFAAVMLVMLGAFQATLGLVALFRDGFFVMHRNGVLIPIDYTTWGWIHLALAALAVGTGIGMLVGALWARIVGALIAVVNVFVMFAFLDSYPWLATMLIAYSIVTLYAIVVHGREVADAYAE
jgi:hypothetical protein